MMVEIEGYFSSIFRTAGFFCSLLWALRFGLRALHEESGCIRMKLMHRAQKYGHDIILILLIPVFAYTAFFANVETALRIEHIIVYPTFLAYMLLNLATGLRKRN